MKSPNWNYEIGWHPVERVCGYRGQWVEIGYNKEGADGYVWCVQCCGAGHYFKTLGECYAYCFGRNSSVGKMRLRSTTRLKQMHIALDAIFIRS